jgi:hypothetical protein
MESARKLRAAWQSPKVASTEVGILNASSRRDSADELYNEKYFVLGGTSRGEIGGVLR